MTIIYQQAIYLLQRLYQSVRLDLCLLEGEGDRNHFPPACAGVRSCQENSGPKNHAGISHNNSESVVQVATSWLHFHFTHWNTAPVMFSATAYFNTHLPALHVLLMVWKEVQEGLGGGGEGFLIWCKCMTEILTQNMKSTSRIWNSPEVQHRN